MNLADWLEQNDPNGKVAAMVGAKPITTGHYHPGHHVTCFCRVCRGDADGHISDQCECQKCRGGQ